MTYFKVICKNGKWTRVRYFQEVNADEAAGRVRTLMKLVPHGWQGWDIVSVTACSEAEFRNNTGPRR